MEMWNKLVRLILGSGRKDRPYEGIVRPTGDLSLRVIRGNRSEKK